MNPVEPGLAVRTPWYVLSIVLDRSQREGTEKKTTFYEPEGVGVPVDLRHLELGSRIGTSFPTGDGLVFDVL